MAAKPPALVAILRAVEAGYLAAQAAKPVTGEKRPRPPVLGKVAQLRALATEHADVFEPGYPYVDR